MYKYKYFSTLKMNMASGLLGLKAWYSDYFFFLLVFGTHPVVCYFWLFIQESHWIGLGDHMRC